MAPSRPATAKPAARTPDKSLQELFDQRIVKRQSELWKTYDEKLGNHGVSRDTSGLTQVSVLEKELERVVKAEGNLSKTRKSGVHQIGAGIQTFATDLQAFLKAYSGLLDIAEAADDHFSGGLAIKALSLLLVVAVNKNAKETKINDILEDSMKCFPRLVKKIDEISQAKIDELQRTLDESQKTINSLKKANDTLLAKKLEASILKLRRDLKVSDASFDLTSYRSLLEKRFARNGKTTYTELKDLLFRLRVYRLEPGSEIMFALAYGPDFGWISQSYPLLAIIGYIGYYPEAESRE